MPVVKECCQLSRVFHFKISVLHTRFLFRIVPAAAVTSSSRHRAQSVNAYLCVGNAARGFLFPPLLLIIVIPSSFEPDEKHALAYTYKRRGGEWSSLRPGVD